MQRRIRVPAVSPAAPPHAEPALVRRLTDRAQAEHRAAVSERCRLVRRQPLWQQPPFDAAGMPVLLVGGMGSTPAQLEPLRELLVRCGCRCEAAPVSLGIGCGEATTREVERALARLAAAAGRPVELIGHSRGGQFARAVAVRRTSFAA